MSTLYSFVPFWACTIHRGHCHLRSPGESKRQGGFWACTIHRGHCHLRSPGESRRQGGIETIGAKRGGTSVFVSVQCVCLRLMLAMDANTHIQRRIHNGYISKGGNIHKKGGDQLVERKV